jgi:DNA polymerase alpha subunit B N-terminal
MTILFPNVRSFSCDSNHGLPQICHNLPHLYLFDEGVTLAEVYSVSSTQLANCWAAYSLNKNVQKLDSHSFDSFRMQVIKECGNIDVGAVITRVGKRQSANKDVPSVTPPSKKANTSERTNNVLTVASNLGRRVSMSPAPPSILSSTDGIPSLKLEKYEERRDPGKVVLSFNPNNLLSATQTTRTTPKCHVSYSNFESNVKESYRHMFTTTDERASALDRHLVELGDQMIERYNLGKSDDESAEVAELEAVGVPRQDKICCIGRICNAVSAQIPSTFKFHTFLPLSSLKGA